VKRAKLSVEATNLLGVPSPETDDKLVTLADWVEVKALLNSDGSASLEDLVRALCRDYSLSDTYARTLAGDAFKELVDRSDSCVPLAHTGRPWEYPFTLNASCNLLCVRGKVTARAQAGMLYKFLLVASRADMDSRRKLNGIDPTTVFEQLCSEILLNFWGGEMDCSGSLIFGTARDKANGTATFKANIEHLCTTLREGRGMKHDANPPGAGDGKLDIVVWRVFSDGRAGGLVGFGQCKTGIHWDTHLTKLDPRRFCEKYLQEPLIIDPIRIYMVPHRVDSRYWNDTSRDGGLLMDRCRLVQYGHTVSKTVFGNCREWLIAALERQRAGAFTA